MEREYSVYIGDTEVRLMLVNTETVSYYSFNLLGNRKLNQIVAESIFSKVQQANIVVDTIFTVEAKAIGLAEELSKLMGIDRYIVARKSVKNYMQKPVIITERTFISGNCNYVIDETDIDYLTDKRVLVVDDVISTGGTITALLKMLDMAEPRNISIACALTEGERRDSFNGIPLIFCDHIPIYR